MQEYRQRFSELSPERQQMTIIGSVVLGVIAALVFMNIFGVDGLVFLGLFIVFGIAVLLTQLLFNLLLTLPSTLQLMIVIPIIIFAPFVLRQLEQLTDFGLLTQVNRALIFVVLAQGLNIVVGFAGLLDLGYAAFFAIGAYTYGLLTWPTHDIEMPFFIGIWLCALVASLFGIIIGTPTLRLRGDYLAIVTLAFGEIIPVVVRNFGDFNFAFRPVHYSNLIAISGVVLAVGIAFNLLQTLIRNSLGINREGESIKGRTILQRIGLAAAFLVIAVLMRTVLLEVEFDGVPYTEKSWQIVEDVNLTGGSQGLTPLKKPSFGWLEEPLGLEKGSLRVGVDPTFWYFAIICTVGIVLFAARRLDDSRLGRAWKAIREDETAADFMGVDPIRTKLYAFAIGASFSGLAGAVYASMLGAIFPDLFRFQVSIFLLIIVVLSGRGSVWGVLVGGLIISIFDGVFLAQVLPDVFPDKPVESLRWVFFGIGLLLIMIFRPQGLFPEKTDKLRTAEGGD